MPRLAANQFLLYVLLACCSPAEVRASDWWDDFTNNLATDLTPLIALFGEQATKQFLSESITNLDNFLIAVAPLGIITVIVSAIRVCGGPSLRAFIGRAQEGGGIAEAELCSSTSRDVCELYHNGAITRVFGRPKILEIIYDPGASAEIDARRAPERVDINGEAKPKHGIYLSTEYFRDAEERGWREVGRKRRTKDKERTAITSPTADQAFTNSPRNTFYSTNDDMDGEFAPNPNLSLNIGIKKHSAYIYWAAAALGLIAQTSVFVFAALITYKLGWKKDDKPHDPWAFPLALSGTIGIIIGMFGCAFLVNDSTKERHFERQKSSLKNGVSASLYIVQPGNQNVGDQTFDPFSFCSSAAFPLTNYVTSWKKIQDHQHNHAQKGAGYRGFNKRQGSSTAAISSSSLIAEQLVVIASITTVIGFILQFVGLRAMHASVSLLQLGVTIIMSIVRALLRTQRLRPEQNMLRDRLDEVVGHELDWLATQIGHDPSEKQRKFWAMTAANPKQDDDESAQDILNKRSRLADLTKGIRSIVERTQCTAWGNEVVDCRLQAQQLKMLIEYTMGLLCANAIHISNPEARTYRELHSIDIVIPISTWEWSPDVGNKTKNASSGTEGNFDGIKKHKRHDIVIKVQQLPTGWYVDQAELEAVLGLWSWSIISDPNSGNSDVPRARITAWGHENDVKKTKREFGFWVDDISAWSPNVELEMPVPRPHSRQSSSHEPSSPEFTSPWEIEASANRLWRFKHGSKTTPYQRLFGWYLGRAVASKRAEPAEPDGTTDIGATMCTTQIPLSTPLATVCAHDLYQVFLCAAMRHFELDAREATMTSTHGSLNLKHPLLDHLLRLFEASGLGTKQDACFTVFPILIQLSCLPQPASSLPTAYRAAKRQRIARDFFAAEQTLHWAWEVSLTCNNDEKLPVAERTLMELGELYRFVMKTHGDVAFALQGTAWMAQEAEKISDTLACGETLRQLAARYQAVIGAGKPPSRSSGRAVLEAIRANDRTEALKLLNHLAVPETAYLDDSQKTILTVAAQKGWIEVVSEMLECNLSIRDWEDNEKRTALSYAAQGGYIEVVRALLDAGANPMLPDARLRTPLWYATYTNNVKVVELFAGLDRMHINARDEDGRTAFFWAAWEGFDQIVEVLWSKGASHDMPDNSGWTPLVAALSNENRSKEAREKTARLFLNEAKLEVWNHQPVWQLALRLGHWFCAEFTFAQNATTAGIGIVVQAKRTQPGEHEDPRTRPRADLVRPIEPGIRYHYLDEEDNDVDLTATVLEQALSEDFDVRAFWSKNGGEVHEIECQHPWKIMYAVLDGLEDDAPLTEGVTDAVLRTEHAETILDLLVKKRKHRLPISVTMIRQSKTTSGVKLLLERNEGNTVLTEGIIAAAASNNYVPLELLQIFFERWGDQVPITESVLINATSSYWAVDVLTMLRERKPASFIATELIVQTILQRQLPPKRETVLEYVFEHCGHQLTVTEGLVEAAVQASCPLLSLQIFHKYKGSELPITERLIVSVLGYGSAFPVGELLDFCAQAKLSVPITEAVIEAWARNPFAGHLLGKLLNMAQGFVLTATMVEAAIKTCTTFEALTAVLNLAGLPLDEGVVLVVASYTGMFGARAFHWLLETKGPVLVTEQLVLAVVDNSVHGPEMTTALLELKYELPINEAILKAVAANYDSGCDIMALLLEECRPSFSVNQAVLRTAAEMGGDTMELLLKKRGNEVSVTPEIVEAAANNVRGGEPLAYILQAKGANIEITETAIINALTNTLYEVAIGALLCTEMEGQLEVTENALLATFEREQFAPVLADLLILASNDVVELTTGVVERAADAGDIGLSTMMVMVKKSFEGKVHISGQVEALLKRRFGMLDLKGLEHLPPPHVLVIPEKSWYMRHLTYSKRFLTVKNNEATMPYGATLPPGLTLEDLQSMTRNPMF
ncbi:Ankyrin repeat domain-containing protein [Paramyrothecium foliicola]|nr:Ankyrin repeat domain-containing protein [Paramyrothecium foliicola]